MCGRLVAPESTDRCRRHYRPVGIHNPQTVHGLGSEYTKNIPRQLFDDFVAAYSDPNLLSCRKEVALLDARISTLFRRIESKESDANWNRVRSAWEVVSRAQRSQDYEKMAMALPELGEAITEGASENEVWREIKQSINQRAALANREVSYMREMREGLTLEQSAILLTRIAGAIEEVIEDPKQRRAIAERLRDVYPPQGFLNIVRNRESVAIEGKVVAKG